MINDKRCENDFSPQELLLIWLWRLVRVKMLLLFFYNLTNISLLSTRIQFRILCSPNVCSKL